MIESTATRLAPWQAEPRRLWSFLDMQRFYAHSFFATISGLERAEASLIMDRIITLPPLSGETIADSTEKAREAVTLTMRQLPYLPISGAIKAQAERLRDRLAGPVEENDASRAITLTLLQELKLNIVNDLKESLFLCVPYQDRQLFSAPEESYWTTRVADAFPEARKDMRECAKCLALGMWTASVFHAMRAAQHGLRRLADRFSIVFSDDFDAMNWGQIIKEIDKALRALEQAPKTTPDRTDDLQFGANASSHFFAIKEAWRNYVMHGRSTYDEAEARAIAANVRAIMLALA